MKEGRLERLQAKVEALRRAAKRKGLAIDELTVMSDAELEQAIEGEFNRPFEQVRQEEADILKRLFAAYPVDVDKLGAEFWRRTWQDKIRTNRRYQELFGCDFEQATDAQIIRTYMETIR